MKTVSLMSHSAIIHDGIALRAARPLQYTIFIALSLFIVAAVGVLATRSIWIDEAMLLRNVYETSVLDFLHPLPFYEQTSPFIPLVVIKLISKIAGTNFILFRIFIFVFIATCTIPLLLELERTYGLNALLVFMLVATANIYTIFFHATEIKHYGFEVAAVFIFLYWFIIYLKNPAEAFARRRIWIPLLVVATGFSTLLLVPGFFLFVALDWIFQHKTNRRVSLKTILMEHANFLVMMAFTAIAVYVFMSHLTTLQMTHVIYKTGDYLTNGMDFLGFFRTVFSKIFMLTAVLIILSFVQNTYSHVRRLSLFFLSTVAVVVVLRLSALYPVTYPRHLIWLVPIGMTIIAMYMCIALSRKETLGLFLMVYVSLFVMGEAVDVLKGNNAEFTANNGMYAALTDIPPSDILVIGWARPSLEIYRMKSPALSKHRYFGLMPGGDLSIRKDSPDIAFAGGGLENQEFTDWQFRQLPQTRSFLVLVGHRTPFELEQPHARNTLEKNNCEYRPTFEGLRAQILKVSCAPPGAGG